MFDEFKKEEARPRNKEKISLAFSCYVGVDRWQFIMKNKLSAAKILNKAIDDMIEKSSKCPDDRKDIPF